MARLIKHTANKRGLKGNTIYNTHQIKDYNIRSAEFRVVIQGLTNIQTSESSSTSYSFEVLWTGAELNQRNGATLKPVLDHFTQGLTVGTQTPTLSLSLQLLLLALSSKATLCLTKAIFCSILLLGDCAPGGLPILLLADLEPGGLPLFLCRAAHQNRWNQEHIRCSAIYLSIRTKIKDQSFVCS